MNNEIKKRLDSIGNKDAIQLFFKLLKKMIIELDLNKDNEKLAINVRNDYRKRISVNLNSHLVLSIKDGDEFGFKVLEKDLGQIETLFPLLRKENFASKVLPAVFIEIKYADLVAHLALIESLWINSCKIYEPQNSKSRYRKHHIPELYELALDGTLLNHYLNNLASPIRSFKDIIKELAVYLKAEDTIISDFEINNAVFTDKYVWISDSQRIIGTLKAHFEITFRRNRLYTAIHFESEAQAEKDVFKRNILTLPAKVKWIDWQKSDSLEFTESTDFNDPQILEKLAGQLLYLEENLGDIVRNILQTKIASFKFNSTMPQPLNQILFGPPGTGKTYNAINRALEIIGIDISGKTRKEIKNIFDTKMFEGQIVFTTFHQGMSYEDFIEGIKPLEPKIEGQAVNYKVVDGIFKGLCREASRNDQFSITIDGAAKTLTKELFEELYYSFSQALPDIGEPISTFELSTKENYPFQLFKNSMDSIAIKAGLKRSNSIVSFNELSLVLFEGKAPTYKSYEQIVINKILEDKNFVKKEVNNSQKKFVLIIDEINRGNVSQIFGELITLIEEDKRLGKDEALEVTLPYSKNEKFGVPSNVYLVGTMNTADRSVEALDAALRRRFSFEEMPPQYQLEQLQYEFAGIKASAILETINKRIEKLLDRDHAIGHSYCMLKGNENAEDKLPSTFYKNIIPLLQEYFFGSYDKIGMVLGKGFVKLKSWDKKDNAFADFDSDAFGDYDDRDVYEIVNYAESGLDYKIKIKGQDVNMDFEKAIKLLMNYDIA